MSPDRLQFRADLHVHTTCSDGTDPPLEVLRLAAKAGLSGLSITDHDTIAAYTHGLWSEAALLGIELLRGVEISSEWKGSTVHILAYGFQPVLEEFLREAAKKRHERNLEMLRKLKRHGIDIDPHEIGLDGEAKIVGRPHLAAAIVKKGKAASIKDAFDRYLKDTACCYVPGVKFPPLEVVEAIQKASGKAVLAHPHMLKQGRFLREILALPWDGIECYYGTLHKNQEAPWIDLAKKKGWIATGGSDYHGALKPHISIGCSWVSEEVFRRLQN